MAGQLMKIRLTYLRTVLESACHWFRPEMPKIGLLAVGGFFNATAEALVLMALAPLVSAISTGATIALETDFRVLAEPLQITVQQLIGFCLLALFLRFGGQFVYATVAARVVSRYQGRMRNRVFCRFLEATWRLQSQEGAGRLHAAMSASVVRSGNVLVASCKMLTAAAAVTVLLASAFLVQPQAALALVIFVVVIFVALQSVSLVAVRYAKKNTRMNRIVAEHVTEVLHLARDYRVFNVIMPIQEGFGRVAAQDAAIVRMMLFLRELIPILYQFAASFGILLYLSWLYYSGIGNIAAIITVALLSIRAFSYGQQLQSSIHRFAEMWPFVEDLREASADFETNADQRGVGEITRIEILAFENVSFEYEPGRPLINGVSFEFARGESLGLIGPSGGGKSTIIQLALGLLRPHKGRVLANGVPVVELAAEFWFDRIGYVPQEPRLLHGTIAENIRFFREGLSDQQVDEAARRAGLHQDILEMPNGFQTIVGEGSGRLSGGQRQRLIIARALANKPDLLVMDEPTSALDFESDLVIRRTLSRLKGEIAVLVVAHRIGTLETCDRVMVVKEGRIVEMAPPSLLKRSSTYYQDAMLGQSR